MLVGIDCVVWWAFYVLNLSVEGGWMMIFSPIVMQLLLMYVSGVPLLERRSKKARPGYGVSIYLNLFYYLSISIYLIIYRYVSNNIHIDSGILSSSAL